MSAQLLYKMIKSKTEYPLHKAIKVEREDVVFLYLIEMDSQVLYLVIVVVVFPIFHAFSPNYTWLVFLRAITGIVFSAVFLLVICSRQSEPFCHPPPNSSSLYPLLSSRATPTVLGRCYSTVQLLDTKIVLVFFCCCKKLP